MSGATSTRSSSRAKAAPSTVPVVSTTRATRTSRATTKAIPRAVSPSKPATKIETQRKAPLSKEDATEIKPIPVATKKVSALPKATSSKGTSIKARDEVPDDREPIRAFLRIRPRGGDEGPSSTPYLSALSDTAVQMIDPSPTPSRFRQVSSTSTYTFSHVYPPETDQATFFKNTALPLVRDLLNGESGLLFAYGVTNSGKTYTIQGGAGEGMAGLLPRCLDVIFNSVESLHSDAPFKPVRLTGVEIDHEASSVKHTKTFDLSASAGESLLASVIAEQLDSLGKDETMLKVDRNFQYSIWVSYAEVYNEKVYDLLSISNDSGGGPLHRTTTIGGAFNSYMNLAALANLPQDGKPFLVTRKALTLKSDPDGGKYIAGLREVRVRDAEEARAIVKMGQINRRVFGTLANTASSRSHGIFTIKVMRIHNGCPEDLDSVNTARLSIVDLAGSERTKNTQNTGDRLKEAGNINNSLMVLGQCMEALRSNQRKVAAGSRPGLVPFRHSKITELFQDFFVGEGKAVMIVNVNPYDTGFDENSHVMKFSALAKDVTTSTVKRTAAQATPSASGAPNNSAKRSVRRVVLSTGGRAGKKLKEAQLEVVEEDEETDDMAEDNEGAYPLVDSLFEQLNEMRIKLYESEMRCALIESEVREEVTREMDERIEQLNKMHAKWMKSEAKENELKTDKKIDMLHRMALVGSPIKSPRKIRVLDETDEDDDEDDEEDDEEDSNEFDQTPSRSEINSSPAKAPSRGTVLDDSMESISVSSTTEASESDSEPPTPSPSKKLKATPIKPVVQKLELQKGLSFREDWETEEEEGEDAASSSSAGTGQEDPSIAQDSDLDEEEEDDDDSHQEPDDSELSSGDDGDEVIDLDEPIQSTPAKATAKAKGKNRMPSISVDEDDDGTGSDDDFTTMGTKPKKSGPSFVPSPPTPEKKPRKKSTRRVSDPSLDIDVSVGSAEAPVKPKKQTRSKASMAQDQVPVRRMPTRGSKASLEQSGMTTSLNPLVIYSNMYNGAQIQVSLPQPSSTRNMSRGERTSAPGNLNKSMRNNYVEHGVDQYYSMVASSYRNPHFPGIQLCLTEWLNAWWTHCHATEPFTVHDMAAGSGEVTIAAKAWYSRAVLSAAPMVRAKLQTISIPLSSAPPTFVASDPYTSPAYVARTELPCHSISFSDIAEGRLPVGQERSTMTICSFALHLAPTSALFPLLYALSTQSRWLVILAPHKKPEIKDGCGWVRWDVRQWSLSETAEIVHERVHCRVYQSLNFIGESEQPTANESSTT